MVDLAHLHPELRRRIEKTINDPRIKNIVTIVSGARTYAQQKRLYDLYLQGRGNLAANPDSHGINGRVGSKHQVQKDGWAYAVDFGLKVHTLANERLVEHVANEHGLVRTVPSEWWHFEIMAPGGRAHIYGTKVYGWGGKGKTPTLGHLENQVIERGDHGSEVEMIQLILIGAGLLAKGSDDGDFGRKTEAAVKKFQVNLGFRGRDVDGRWGPATSRRTDALLTWIAAMNRAKAAAARKKKAAAAKKR